MDRPFRTVGTTGTPPGLGGRFQQTNRGFLGVLEARRRFMTHVVEVALVFRGQSIGGTETTSTA
jgi:hypothetical protein